MVRKFSLKTVKTGISGLDILLGGGVPTGNLILLSGVCGTGKTTLGMQYLVSGAKKGENGVFISMEEDLERLKNYAMLFGWDVEKLEKEKKLAFLQMGLLKWKEIYKLESFFQRIKETIEKVKAKRLVLDSLSVLGYHIRESFELRRVAFFLGKMLKEADCTALVISEVPEGSNKLSSFGVEEYVADGVILLQFLEVGERLIRTIVVRKMRGMEHSTKICPMRITSKGMEVFPAQEIFGPKNR